LYERLMASDFHHHAAPANDVRRFKMNPQKHTKMSERLSVSRRAFCVSAGLGIAACAVRLTRAAEVAAIIADSRDMPDAQLLCDGEVKTYLLAFHTGQEVMKGLLAFAMDRKLVGGHLTGIGAVSNAEIGYFDPDKKRYARTREWANREVLSVIGNLAIYEGAPVYHVHVALGQVDGSSRGGHLFGMVARPEVELILTTYPKAIRRKSDASQGLPLIVSD
jgi:predicted DNA-binding protein with PD1-like motif